MKKIIIFLMVTVLFGAAMIASAQTSEKVVSINTLPATMDDFLALRDNLPKTPEGGAALFVVAMYGYTQDPDLGTDMFTVALDRTRLSQNAGGYKGFVPAASVMNYPKSYLIPKPYLARSYFMETGPDTGYTLPQPPYTVRLTRNKHSQQNNGDVKIFVDCSGADSPRPIILRQNNRGIWKAVNVNSLFVGIRPPKEVINDDL